MIRRARTLRPGSRPRQLRRRPVAAPDTSVTAADIAATKRIVVHVRSFLELLADDLCELQAALDGRSGDAGELAARLLDDAGSWRY